MFVDDDGGHPELANSLKSAEYRYHWHLLWASAAIALVEGFFIAAVQSTGTGAKELLVVGRTVPVFVFDWIVAAGLLIVFAQGSKSLTDVLVGIGHRMKT